MNDKITGKVLVFTDLHLGLKNASKSRLTICINVIKEIIAYIKANDIQTIIFCGDWNHVRTSTENNVLNVSYKLMQALSKYAKVYMILGNHDLYLKNSVEISSLVIFKDMKNVVIVDKPYQVSINNNISLLVPWLGDISNQTTEFYDMLFGHFDISHKYLVKSYIEEHTENFKISKESEDKLINDNLLQSENNLKNNSGDYIGNFVDIAKIGGVIFSGHIHARKEFLAKKRKFIFVGDPYQQNLGEAENKCGFYVINENNSYKFHEINNIPKHVQLKISDILKSDVDKFDFSIVKNNIVHKIYDVEVDRIIDAKISQKITDWGPYEELLPDYNVEYSTNSEIKLQNESIELIKKSKLDYIKNYIDNIDENILIEQNINKDKLYNILKNYYISVADEK